MSLTVSTRSRYGIRLMIALALDYGSGVSLLRNISKREGISEKYLGQIIISLKTAGLVNSQRGSHGGYALSRPPVDITARDVVEAIEGRISPVPCVDDPEACEGTPHCAANGLWRKLRDDIRESLSSFTLAELARQAKERGASAASYEI